MQGIWRTGILTLGLVCLLAHSASAQLTPKHRRELTELTRQIGQASAAIKKKKYDEAGTLLNDADLRLKDIATSTGLSLEDPTLGRVSNLLSRQQAALEKATGTGGGKGASTESEDVSFMKDIAPVIVQRCVECHGENNPRNNLRLDSFAGWRAGGRSGLLLVPGNPNASLIMARLNAPADKGRMPRNGNPLSDEEKEKISEWIKKGAKFDGAQVSDSLASLLLEEAKKNVKLPVAKGTEKVKFTRDIAPWMTTLCLNCHNARRQAGGFSVASYFDIMKGGESGEVVIPGDRDNSRLFRLVGGLELPRMPQSQARLTRKNYEDLKLWFEEGNTYDGGDPLTPISTFAAVADDPSMNEFSSKSDAEMAALRKEQTEELYSSVSDWAKRTEIVTETCLMVGDVSPARMKEVQQWVDETIGKLKREYPGGGPLWRGRLAIVVWKDRDEFEQTLSRLDRRRPDSEQRGDAKVTPGHGEALVVLQDGGDKPTRGPSLKDAVVEEVAVAYLQRGNRALPAWAVHGAGLLLVEKETSHPQRLKEMQSVAASLAPAVASPTDVFQDNSFSQASIGPVGYTLTKYLIDNGGQQRLAQLFRALEKGDSLDAALRSTYGQESATIANGFIATMKAR